MTPSRLASPQACRTDCTMPPVTAEITKTAITVADAKADIFLGDGQARLVAWG